MSAGLEIRGQSIRIWIRYDDLFIRETLQHKATPQSIQQAEKLVELIKLEIEMGTFELHRHFPHSKHIRINRIEYYAEKYLKTIKTSVAPITYESYHNHIYRHILPKWAELHPKHLTTTMINDWISQLQETLHNKTIREIISRFASIHKIWRDDQQQAYNPFQSVSIKKPDNPEPDPFTKSEIQTILDTETEQDMIHLLPCIFWTGLSISEQMALAWQDIDLDKGIMIIQRSYVKGNYRVTKNKRRKRKIILLEPALNALKQQYKLTGTQYTTKIRTLQRDNKTYLDEKLNFVWVNFSTQAPYNYQQINYRWKKHLKKCAIRYRAINQGRHTFASQLLSCGTIPAEWIAEQMGHTDTSMIYRHYGKLIQEDIPDYIGQINEYIKQG